MASSFIRRAAPAFRSARRSNPSSVFVRSSVTARWLGLAFALGAALTAVRGAAPASEQTFRSGPHQVTLLELYTSEGCSSCPPAEAWLGELRHDPHLWRDFVPVAFHVDYWDRLGWRDTLATAANTARQYAYAERWTAGSVYTPCFVRNGAEWKLRRSREWQPMPAKESGELSLNWTSQRRWARIYFVPRTKVKLKHPDVTVALLGNGITHAIRSGENAGRELRHEFVALALETKPLRAAADGWTAEFSLPWAVSTDATSFAVAAWITNDRGEVVQAVGGAVEKTP